MIDKRLHRYYPYVREKELYAYLSKSSTRNHPSPNSIGLEETVLQTLTAYCHEVIQGRAQRTDVFKKTGTP